MVFDWQEEWNISFAGCGFRSIYYVGALSCILERVPQLVHGASKICGASSGCLVAAALTVGIPIELCVAILTAAKEARKHTLGVFHPTFSLLRTLQVTLLDKLPEDAHLRASGKLCVSLTRMVDGQNVLVSEFASREDLIQVLMCSCFFPAYSGFTAPSYQGVRYMDGALSNNVPLCEQRNTIIVAPFSGESDICPREGTYNFFEASYGNVSIQVNTGNVHRICTSFLPQKPETLAEICYNGYKDALRFLRERDLLRVQPVPRSVMVAEAAGGGLDEASANNWRATNYKILNGNLRAIENLPVHIMKVLCEACRDRNDGVTWWSRLTDSYLLRLVVFLLALVFLPIQTIFFLTKMFLVLSIDVYGQSLRGEGSPLKSITAEQQSSNGSTEHSKKKADMKSTKL
ncbi:patatin-like phospholipase domain-containing protein 2 isoform X2 [Gouania willdenowi]|uniref:patatin-like phospholipase domain-containing protein 2 isoform X2 n=1 Tax=Gouania willdenowi TaxID=441366 RepID=UPI001056CDEC|nr:patatin-like phospholipase domain-containing protein 2 isoform X2 [Gouania willdenowi]